MEGDKRSAPPSPTSSTVTAVWSSDVQPLDDRNGGNRNAKQDSPSENYSNGSLKGDANYSVDDTIDCNRNKEADDDSNCDRNDGEFADGHLERSPEVDYNSQTADSCSIMDYSKEALERRRDYRSGVTRKPQEENYGSEVVEGSGVAIERNTEKDYESHTVGVDYSNVAAAESSNGDFGKESSESAPGNVAYVSETMVERVSNMYSNDDANDGSSNLTYGAVASERGHIIDYSSDVASEPKMIVVQQPYSPEGGTVASSVHYSPPPSHQLPPTANEDMYDQGRMSPHFSDMDTHHAVSCGKRMVEMYCAADDDDDGTLDIPSTTTTTTTSVEGANVGPSGSSPDDLKGFSIGHPPPSPLPPSILMMKSSPYHQHLDEYSPEQPQTSSSTGNFTLAMDTYERMSPSNFHHHPHHHHCDLHHSSHTDGCISVHHSYTARVASADDEEMEAVAEPDGSSPNEISVPASSSSNSSAMVSPTHHSVTEASSSLLHAESVDRIDDGRFAIPPPLLGASSVDQSGGHHHHHHQHQHLESQHQQLVDVDHGSPNRHHHHHHHHPHHYYEDCGEEQEPLDLNLVRLVNQRLPSLMAPGMLTDPLQKQLLVESVVRSMMGVQAGRLFLAEGVLTGVLEEPVRPLPSHHEAAVDAGVVDGQFVGADGYVSVPAPQLQLAPSAEDLAEGHALVDHHLIEDHQVAGPSRVSLALPHPSREATPGLDNSSLSGMSGVGAMIPTTVPGLLHDSEMLQVPHVSEASTGQSYVSSSTGGMEHDHHSLSRHASILDATVDSTVEMDITSDHHLPHSQNLMMHDDDHYIDQHHHAHPHESVVLKYSADLSASEHYSVIHHQHRHHLDSGGQGVSTTRSDVGDNPGGQGLLLVAHEHGDPPCYGTADDDRMNATPSSSTVQLTPEEVAKVNVTTSSNMLVDVRNGQRSPQRQLVQGASSSIVDNRVEPLTYSRPRRQLTKQKLAGNIKMAEPYDPDDTWCEECNLSCNSVCTKHRVRPIFDKPVLTRAWASLPASYLSISKVSLNSDAEPVFGVFTKKPITKRTQFGPLEGVPNRKETLATADSSRSPTNLVFQIEMESGELVDVDVTDENLSNWMRFVRAADNHAEQNVVIVQQSQSLYYTSTTDIAPRTELRLGYSTQYANRRGLHVLEMDIGLREPTQENSWPCFECSQTFATSDELQEHLNEHDMIPQRLGASMNDGGEIGVCVDPVQIKKTKARPSNKLLKKVRSRLAPKKFKPNDSAAQTEFKCNFCHKIFPRPYSLQRHLAMHSGEKKFKCTVCEMKFTHVYNRNRHMRRHRAMEGLAMIKKPIKLFKRKRVGSNEWLCTHCNLTFTNPSLLNLHTLTHAAEDVELGDGQPQSITFYEQAANNQGDNHATLENGIGHKVMIELHECPQCTQEFFTRKELIDHASTHGKIMIRKSFRGIVNPAKPHKCELCYKSFATEDRLHRHMLVHGNEEAKPLKCIVCEKRFLNNSALACHIKVHSDERKFYECPICNEEFDQIVSLKEHIRIHSINGVFTCPTCQKTFDEYNLIRKHIRAFHSEKKFPCGHCDKIFPRPDKLKLHMLRHSSHREFLCQNCGKQFKRKDKLKEHMKRMHSIEREARLAMKPTRTPSSKKFIPKVSPNDYHRFIYKCHSCLLGFKRRGMLVNHLAKRHPSIRPESVPELNLPILKTTRDYYCQYCEKVYKSSSKRKAHILKQHPGADLPMSNRRKGGIPEIPGLPNPTFSQTVGSITTHPHSCEWCHKQYASKAKLLQHQRKKHLDLLPNAQQVPRSHHRDVKCEVHGHRMAPQQLSRSDHREVVCEVHGRRYVTVPTVLQHQMSATTQTSSMDVEYEDVIDATTEDIKPKILATISADDGSIYVAQENNDGAIIVASTDVDSEQVDIIPPADLLTQAMSELTQSLVVEYRTTSTHHHLEYSLDRVTQSCPPAMLMPSPTSTPGLPTSTTVADAEDASSHLAIEQSQLGQLLSHYEEPSAQQTPMVVSSQDEAGESVSNSWAATNYTEYPAR